MRRGASFAALRRRCMLYPEYRVPRIPLLRGWMNREQEKRTKLLYAPTPVLRHLRDRSVSQRNLRLSQPQYDAEYQEGEVHALCGVEDDGHPRAPVAIGGVSVQQAGEHSVRYPPGLVNVIETEECAVGYPTEAPEHAFHLGQEHSPKEELLPQDRVEHGVNHEQGEEPPGTL